MITLRQFRSDVEHVIYKARRRDFFLVMTWSLQIAVWIYYYTVFANLVNLFPRASGSIRLLGAIRNIQQGANDMAEFCPVLCGMVVSIVLASVYFSANKLQPKEIRNVNVTMIVLVGLTVLLAVCDALFGRSWLGNISIAALALSCGYVLSDLRKRLLKQNPHSRPARIKDIPRLHFIRTAVRENALSNPNLITPADYEEFMFRRGKGWVCEIGNHIVGFAICDLQDENIWALFVHPDFERRGVARELQTVMLDWYFTQRNKVWLGTAPGTRAEAFYRKSGWREAGTHGKEVKFELTKDEWFTINHRDRR